MDLIIKLLTATLYPPFSLLILLMAGLLLLKYKARLGQVLILLSLLLFWACSSIFVTDKALGWLEQTFPPVEVDQHAAQAIVVIGAGSYFNAPEYDPTHTVSRHSLERIRYAAKLQRETGLPLLVSGGAPKGNQGSEAEQMARVLTREFQVPVRWQEAGSNTTLQNAFASYQRLKAEQIHKIYLVTHAWHMPRAHRIFTKAGFDVVAAPTAFTTQHEYTLLEFIPNAYALYQSRLFIHEIIGMIWYELRTEL